MSNLFFSALSFHEWDFLYLMCLYDLSQMDLLNNSILSVFHLAYCVTMFQQCNMTLKLRMHFIYSIYFLGLGSNTLNVNSTVILMIRIQIMCLHHCSECYELDLNQRDWTLKRIEACCTSVNMCFLFLFCAF